MLRLLLSKVDFGLLLPVFVLIAVSLTTLFSISSDFFKTQLFFLIISVLAFLFFSQINFKLIQRYEIPIYVVSFILLLVVLFLGIESRGAVRWLEFLGVRLQLSEIFKPFLAISVVTFLSRRPLNLKTFLQTFLLLLPIVFLIYKQPDLGNALLYLITTFFALFIVGFPIVWFGIGLAAFALTIPFFWGFLHDYQRQRILTYLRPSSDPLGNSYNAIQSIIAVGSGSFFGKGFNETTQSGLRFLPERHTDFIFATLSESSGFIGGCIVLIAIGFLLYKIFQIYQNSEDSFSKYLAIFAFSNFLIQSFVNIGMNIGLLPIVGVTLPFVSYGGSSLLSSFIFLGLLSSIHTASRGRDVLEIR